MRFIQVGSSFIAATFALAAALLAAAAPSADPLTPPANSPRRIDPGLHALTNATLHPEPGKVIENATVVIRNGVIAAINGPAPADANVWDCSGLHLYAGFVDPFVEVEAASPDRDRAGAHWSLLVVPQRSALEGKGVLAATAKSLREMGFVAATISPRGGIFRGESATVSLAEPDRDLSQSRPPVYASRVYQTVAFELASGTDTGENLRWDAYPDSEMGAIALIRQTLIDADHRALERKTAKAPLAENALDALVPTAGKPVPLLLDARDELEAIRLLRIAKEFSRPAIVLGSGTEFRRLAALTVDKPAVILPLNFPAKPNVSTIGDADAVDLRSLMTWEQAPTNPKRLRDAGATVALSAGRSRERGKFMEHLRLAIRHGLSEDDALRMLTVTPASLVGVSDQLGTIAPGKRASLIVADGPIFKAKTKLRDLWIDGQRHELSPAPIKLTGTWEFALDPAPKDNAPTLTLLVTKDNALSLKIAKAGEEKPKTTRAKNVKIDPGRVSFTLDPDPLTGSGVVTHSGALVGETMTGTARRADGSFVAWTAKRTSKDEPKPDPKDDKKPADSKDNKDDKKDDKKDENKEDTPDPLAGTWSLTFSGPQLPNGELAVTVVITGAAATGYSGRMDSTMGATNLDSVTFDPQNGSLAISLPAPGGGKAELRATVTGNEVVGTASAMQQNFPMKGTRSGSGKADGEESEEPVKDVPSELPGYPFGAYARASLPPAEHIVFTNATVWTSGPAGRIENGEVEINDSKVVYAGKARGTPTPAGARVVDAKGKHITPGIIDCHSHTGISGGVNESGQAVTAEVRIQDVTNPDAVNWYRQLAGGVTTVNNLHGSANPIGGQNCVNKPRWGAPHPDDFHFAGRDTYADANPFDASVPPAEGLVKGANAVMPGIKFALGENVKQSNWGDRNTWRYPQTRMGVEAIIRDRFSAAKDYAAAWAAWVASGRQGLPPRRDLELEALAQLLAHQRLIHCHSYRQDEILMLARLTAEFGFKLGSYQHILEGYKVADAVRDSSLGASAFSDWWGYKVEVQDAIPQAGPIMHEVGVDVSYNSDSDELARRLNVEAGKARKYSLLPDGRHTVSEEEALKFVTLNPAKQLAISDRVGSLEPGKDADLVVWNGPPLSAFSKAEQTWIDGRCYFSLENDAALREANQKTRQRIIQKLLADSKKPDAKPGDENKSKADDAPANPTRRRRPPQDDRAGSLLFRMSADSAAFKEFQILDLIRLGNNPEDHRRGICGCE